MDALILISAHDRTFFNEPGANRDNMVSEGHSPFFGFQYLTHNNLYAVHSVMLCLIFKASFGGCSLFSCDVSMWVREKGVPFGLHAGAFLSTWTDPPHPPWAVSVWGRGFDTSSERERNTYPFPLTKTILRLLFKQHHLTKQHRLKQKHSPRTILPIERRKARF